MFRRALERSVSRDRMVKKYLYVNGDSWMGHTSCGRVLNDNQGQFSDIFVINRAAAASSNLDIIHRTQQDLAILDQHGIHPLVCIALSEVGRGFKEEFKLGRPSNNINDVLESVLAAELTQLKELLKPYRSYICNAWTMHDFPQPGVIGFIEQDWHGVESVYAVGNGIYKWLDDRQAIFRFSKQSFVNAVNNKQHFEECLLNNPHVNQSLHLVDESYKVFQDFFTHVAVCLDM